MNDTKRKELNATIEELLAALEKINQRAKRPFFGWNGGKSVQALFDIRAISREALGKAERDIALQ